MARPTRTIRVPRLTKVHLEKLRATAGELGPFITAPLIETEQDAIRMARSRLADELEARYQEARVIGLKKVIWDEPAQVWAIVFDYI